MGPKEKLNALFVNKVKAGDETIGKKKAPMPKSVEGITQIKKKAPKSVPQIEKSDSLPMQTNNESSSDSKGEDPKEKLNALFANKVKAGDETIGKKKAPMPKSVEGITQVKKKAKSVPQIE